VRRERTERHSTRRIVKSARYVAARGETPLTLNLASGIDAQLKPVDQA